MNAVHIAISIANLAALVVAIIGFLSRRPNVFSFGVVGGYLANAIAVVVAMGLLVLIVAKSSSGSAREFIRGQWLGLANGATVVASWAAFFAIGRLA